MRALAASEGITLPAVSTGGHDWRDRVIIAAAGLLTIALIVLSGRRLRRARAERTQPEQ